MADSNTCSCCKGVTPLTPVIDNPPGQAALAYRVGTHGQFKTSMQAQITGQVALGDLTTRDDDDASIALLDAWATTLDVLTFYQERIANEGYLRTSTERRSLLELARSIGYELRPGVAASTYLAFELESAPGSPEKVTLAVGTKTQTIPGQDELPQTFETVEVLEARPAWNKLKAKTTMAMLPEFGSKQLYLQGVTTQLKRGDGILIVGKERKDDPSSEHWDFRRITNVAPLNDAAITLVEWAEGLGWSRPFAKVEPTQEDIKVYAFRQRAALFGHNAPEWRSMPDSVKANYLAPGGLSAEYFDNINLTNLKLKRTDPGVNFAWDTGSPDPAIGSDTFSVRWTGFVKAVDSGEYTFYTVSDDGVRLWVDNDLIIDSWVDQPSTEHSGKITLSTGQVYQIILEYYENRGSAKITLSWSPPGKSKTLIPANQLYPLPPDEWPDFILKGISGTTSLVCLDALYPTIVPKSWLILSSPDYVELYQVEAVIEDSRKNFGLTSKTTRVTLKGENLLERFNRAVRETVVYAASEELFIADAPDTSDIEPGINAITVQSQVTGLAKGRKLIVAGPEGSSGAPVAEMVLLDRIEAEADGTRLVFQSNLLHRYRRAGTVIHANVAAATHGEIKNEVLGSGDASQPFQQFLLKQSPLTYTATDQMPSGSSTTLAVRVNDVLWAETPSLYGLGPRDREYVTRIDDDGKVTVMFGDGQSGARPPTGAENVRATYRVGTGLAGMVKANQISLLMTRPLGAKGVTNPIAPEGAKDPETRDQARQNAPLTVLTLDRVVSLRDFEDFAQAFGGIGKAQAVWLWDGERRIVHVTVAAADGGAVPQGSDLRKHLRNAIEAACDPTQHFQIDSFKPLTFTVVVKVKLNAQYLPDKVLAAITAAVTQAFSFQARTFGQPVTISELIALIQHVDGVVYVDLDPESLKCVEQSDMKPPLVANVAHWQGNAIVPAELLTLSKAANNLQVIVI